MDTIRNKFQEAKQTVISHLGGQQQKQKGQQKQQQRQQQQRKQGKVPPPPEKEKRTLDLLFIHDATGSQEPYIQETTQRCKQICELLRKSGDFKEEGGLRMGLIAYRDHPQPNGDEDEFISMDYGGFTYDDEKLLANIKSLTAEGGGDFPEAVADALHAALSLDWRPEAAKIAVLLTDAAPHGIGEEWDSFPEGCPDGHDPLKLARQMAQRGISLLVVACEPGLSDCYLFAKDFYNALANMTSGMFFPLTKTEVLSTFIVGASMETAALDTLVKEHEESIVQARKEGKEVDEIVRELYAKLKARGDKITTVQANTPYKDIPEAAHNVKVFMDADTVGAARKELKALPEDASRFKPSYDDIKYSTPPSASDSPEVEVTFKNLGDDIIEVILGDDIDKPNPRKWIVRPGFLIPIKVRTDKPHNFLAICGRLKKTMGFYFTKQQQDMDWWKFFV